MSTPTDEESDVVRSCRRLITETLNGNPQTREQLEAEYGKDAVWDTEQLQEVYRVMSFSAPFCYVARKSDGEKGVVLFQHAPRFYFMFQGENADET